MRTFEIALIVVNLLSLFLGLKKQPKAVWLGTAGVNLAVFLVHALFEGLRYQMVFAYLFVVLLAVLAAVKTNDRLFEARTPKAVKVIVAGLAVVGLALTAFLAAALPVFRLPELTGDYNVGIHYFHFVDTNRNEPFLEGSTQKRELMVKIYYPAQTDESKPYTPYFRDSAELLRLLAAGYGLPDFLLSHLRLVKTYSKEGLPLANGEPSYPVILFSHGGGTTMEVHTAQAEDLASHGYIVVAIDHPYVSSATIFPNRVVSAREATTNFDSGEPVVIISQIMADDARFVIDKLEEMNDGRVESIFHGRLDLNRIGVAGHSLGGAVAYNLAIHDNRVKAALNLDGAVYVMPEADQMAPFLMLANDRYHVQAIQERQSLMRPFAEMPELDQEITRSVYGSQEAYDQIYSEATLYMRGLAQVLQASGNLYTIAGSDHMKFIDVGFFFGLRPVRELINIGGATDPARCLEITQSVTLAFFGQQLKGGTADALPALIQRYPELRSVDLNNAALH